LSEEAPKARAEFVKRLRAVGVETVTDDMANMYATLPVTEAGLPRICNGITL